LRSSLVLHSAITNNVLLVASLLTPQKTKNAKTVTKKKKKNTVVVDLKDDDTPMDVEAPAASKPPSNFESEPSSEPKPAAAAKKVNPFDMMMGKGAQKTMKKKTPAKAPRKRAAPSSSAGPKRAAGTSNRNAQLKSAYTDGDGLPILSHPQDMFDDMMKKAPQFADVIKHLSRPLRVATMCSGTESPVLALDMMSRSAEDQYGVKLEIEHLFSCEIEPFKQAYIQRNFQPPILFRDIRELGRKQAITAFGSLVDVPGGVDMLIAGTSCVDYSNLNNEKKTIHGSGESGQTFRGMLDWIKKNEPPIVILENVSGAPWDKKVQIFEEEMGYHATFSRVDTKKYYIPQTRSRGYLFAVKKKRGVSRSCLTEWKGTLDSYRRNASAALDAFMFPSDDPRVLKGRERLAAGRGDAGERTGRVDWARCEARHLFARSDEELGDKRPLTGWSDSGNTTLPSYGWNDWANAQVHRIHDLMDINTLRLAKEGVDGTYKTMVWNLSQNVDRDTMGKLGLCQCLTPTGVPYVSNRGGPLVGEELLLLQGIPADDLLLTRETEDNLKDLAGNAMSTTVVGACMLAAMIVSQTALKPEGEPTYTGDVMGGHVAALVPRALDPENGQVKVTDGLGEYSTSRLNLSPSETKPVKELLKRATMSCRKCTSEGRDLVVADMLICEHCGNTSSVECAYPPRKFEEHSYKKMKDERLVPAVFHAELMKALPMRLQLTDLVVTDEMKPESVDEKLWSSWTKKFRSTINHSPSTFAEFTFRSVVRGEVWVASYGAPGAQIELILNERKPVWLLRICPPASIGDLRSTLERPVARMVVKEDATSLMDGAWELCLPGKAEFDITIEGAGDQVDSWEARIGLKGRFDGTKRYSSINIKVDDANMGMLGDNITGTYDLLPKCGTACGSLHKRRDGELMYFFLESGRCAIPDSDMFIFSDNKRRLTYGEDRGAVAFLDSKYRPVVKNDGDKIRKVKCTVPGFWTKTKAKIEVVDDVEKTTVKVPKASIEIAMKPKAWEKAPEIVSVKIPLTNVTAEDKLWKKCDVNKSDGKWTEVNLQKSKMVFDKLAFFTGRLDVPGAIQEWNKISTQADEPYGFDCLKCAPRIPGVSWTVVSQGGKHSYKPQEDVQEAGAYEQALKQRPRPFKVQLKKDGEFGLMQLGCNGFR